MPRTKGSTAEPKAKAKGKARSGKRLDEELDKPASAGFEPKDKGVRLSDLPKPADADANLSKAARDGNVSASPLHQRKRIGNKTTSELAGPENAAGSRQVSDAPRTPDAGKQLAHFRSPTRHRVGTPQHTGASPIALGLTASPKAKSLAASASGKKRNSTQRGGVLTNPEQQAFQAWLKRQRVAGTSKALEWSVHHQDEGWRREFHAAWKVQRDNTKNEASQVSSHFTSTTTSGHDDWFTLFEFAAIEKLDSVQTVVRHSSPQAQQEHRVCGSRRHERGPLCEG